MEKYELTTAPSPEEGKLENFRVVTDGEKFRIETKIKTGVFWKKEEWVFLYSTKIKYSYPNWEIVEFDTLKESNKFIEQLLLKISKRNRGWIAVNNIKPR